MKYYKINFTLNPALLGTNDYIKNSLFRESLFKGFYWENPKFIGNLREKINFNPDVVDVELLAKSKLHDLIMSAGPVSSKLLVSGKLKLILERYRSSGIQYFQFNVIKNKITYDDYWILHMYEFNQEYIDFKRSKIVYEKKKEDFETTYQTGKIFLKVNSLNEFNEHLIKARENREVTFISKLYLLSNIIKDDFFSLRNVESGIGYYVSEILKMEIEYAGCTGIEFQPSYLSFSEWTQREGPRDQVYGRSW